MPAHWIKLILKILPQIGHHGNVPWGIGKRGPDRDDSRKYFLYGEKIVKIGPIDADIYLVDLKKRNFGR